MTFDAAGTGEALLAGRVVFAFAMGYLAVGNLRSLSGTVGYARSKGVPAAGLMVPATSLMLFAGAAAILTGAYPALGGLAVVGFLAGVTPVMHDFWNREGMERQNEQTAFLKNAALAAAGLVFFALSATPWPYAVGLGLW